LNSSNAPAEMRFRFFAGLLDLALVIGLPLVVLAVLGGAGGAIAAVLTLVALIVAQMAGQAKTGAMLGDWVVGIRLVDAETGEPVGTDRVLLRLLMIVLPGLTVVGAVVVLASPSNDPERHRGWHDNIIGAEVVHLGNGIVRQPAPSQPVFERSPEPATGQVHRVAGRPAPGRSVGRPAPLDDVASPPTTPVRVTAAPAAPVVGVQREEVPLRPHGLMPELERTRRTAARQDVAWDDEETYRPMTAEIEMSDGSSHEVQGVVLIGRNPITGPGQTGLRLADRERSVSRTHLRLTVGPIAVWIEDLGTVNGTILHLPDGTDEVCESGRPVQLPIGSVVSVGDAWMRLGGVSGEPTFPERTAKR